MRERGQECLLTPYVCILSCGEKDLRKEKYLYRTKCGIGKSGEGKGCFYKRVILLENVKVG